MCSPTHTTLLVCVHTHSPRVSAHPDMLACSYAPWATVDPHAAAAPDASWTTGEAVSLVAGDPYLPERLQLTRERVEGASGLAARARVRACARRARAASHLSLAQCSGWPPSRG